MPKVTNTQITALTKPSTRIRLFFAHLNVKKPETIYRTTPSILLATHPSTCTIGESVTSQIAEPNKIVSTMCGVIFSIFFCNTSLPLSKSTNLNANNTMLNITAVRWRCFAISYMLFSLSCHSLDDSLANIPCKRVIEHLTLNKILKIMHASSYALTTIVMLLRSPD